MEEDKDPLYPRILLTPMSDGWIAEVEFSMEISVATGPFDDVMDALHDALLRMDKEASESDEDLNNRRPGDEEPGC